MAGQVVRLPHLHRLEEEGGRSVGRFGLRLCYEFRLWRAPQLCISDGYSSHADDDGSSVEGNGKKIAHNHKSERVIALGFCLGL